MARNYIKDDKRLLRRMKRDIKQSGNRLRRRFLKDIDADPGAFDFGRRRSKVMNEPPAMPPAPNPAQRSCGRLSRGYTRDDES